MSIELEKIKSESEKAKLKLEKNEAKQSKKILTIKGLKISKSTGNLDSIPKPNSSTCIDLVLKAKLYSEANIDLKPLIRSTTEKYVQFMITTLQESYTTIKNIKLASIQPVIKLKRDNYFNIKLSNFYFWQTVMCSSRKAY